MENDGNPVLEFLGIRRRLGQRCRKVDILPALDFRMDTANPGYVRRFSERNRLPGRCWNAVGLENTG